MNHDIAGWFASGEDWLMARILRYAKRQGYTRYTSTLEEAWRISIHQLTQTIISALACRPQVEEFSPEESFEADPICEFALAESRRHRQRGIPLTMFLGLFKYYRQAYLDRLADAPWDRAEIDEASSFVLRVFDRLEIAFSGSWAQLASPQLIEELQRTNRDLTNQKNRFLTVTESLGSPVIHLDEDRSITYANQAALTLLGRSARPGTVTYDPGAVELYAPPWLAEIAATVENEGKVITAVNEVATDHGERSFTIRAHPMLDISDKFLGTAIILHDITELRRAETALEARARDLEKLSSTDELTGLLNRRGLFAFGEKHIGLARRSGRPLSVLYADLDDLKVINDRYGHAAGDAALVAFAEALRASFRQADVVARIGGDEFVVIMADSVSAHDRGFLDRLRHNLAAELDASSCTFDLSFSADAVEFDLQRHPSLDDLVAEADRKMYQLKRQRGGPRQNKR